MRIGQAELTPVIEIEAGPVPAFALCDGWDQSLLEPHAAWLYPRHIEPVSGNALLSHHSWLLRIGDTTILVDPCIGNDKRRDHPAIAYYDMLDTPWLDRLAAAAAKPEDIDIVVCTHLHADHCGWNTRLVDGQWVPTFPNARYVVSAAEVTFWEEFSAHPDRYPQYAYNLGVFADSMTPVIAAGLATLAEPGDSPGPGLTLMATPGHTTGHSSLLYADDLDGICFSGDVFHTPVNVLFPQWSMLPGGNHDSAAAAVSRLAVLDHCVETGHLLAPAHFQAPHCCRVGRATDGSYTITW